MFKVKVVLAKILYYLGISKILLKINTSKNNGQNIRILNYHNTSNKNILVFKNQLEFFKKYYEIITFKNLKDFLDKKYTLKKPGLILTFDDGLEGNYETVKEILEPLNIGAIFFVSSDKIGKNGYMSKKQIEDIIENPIYEIGCHTNTHYRMDKNDSIEISRYEIIDSKNSLEKEFGINIDSFCWVGGELETYTKQANDLIKENYVYSFMTNNKLVFSNENKYFLERTNIEENWGIPLVAFQLSGLLDKKYSKKRKIIFERLNS